MTWLEFRLKVGETTSLLTSEAVPVIFTHGDREISPDDITVRCEGGATGDVFALVIDLKESPSGTARPG